MRQLSWPHRLSIGTRLLAAAGLLAPFAAHAEVPALAARPDAPATRPAAAPSWSFHADHVLGTSLDVVAVSRDEATAREALAVVRAEIDRLDRVLSTYRADSELSALNACDGMAVSEDLYAVIAACERWRTATGGAFSGRLGAALAQWQAAAAGGTLDPAALQQVVAQAEAATLTLDAASRTVKKPVELKLAMDALAKGYIIDRALDAARDQVEGLDGLLVDLGGDLRSWGRAPQLEGWRVGVAQPEQIHDNAPVAAVLLVGDQAVATSGRGQRDLTVAGERHAHIVSPRSGQAVTLVERATVVADRAADADALATAFAVMPAAQSLALADSLPGVEALLFTADGRQLHSAGWPALAARREQAAEPRFMHTADAAAAPWPASFALSIDYEVPKIDTGEYKAPYLAIWITDTERKLVRNLTHLGNKEKWIDSNYVWWRRYGRKIEQLDAVTKPTRMPGKYSIGWDGSDETGRKVGQGKYLVHVEASREHGGHTYQTFEVELGAKPLSQPAPAKEELGAIVLRFGKGA